MLYLVATKNQHHPLIFKTATTGGSEHTTDVTFYVNGVVANSATYKTYFNNSTNRYVKIKVTNSTPTKLYYDCKNHSGMGGSSFNMFSSVSVMGIETFATGDMIYADATNNLTKLAAGSNGQTLKINSSGIPAWGTVADVDVSASTDIGTTAQSMVGVGTANYGLNLNFSSKYLHINGKIPSSAGQVLYYDGTDIKWNSPGSSASNQLLEIITGDDSNGGTWTETTYHNQKMTLSAGGNNTFTLKSAYTPPSSTTKLIVIFNFALYDENLSSEFTIDLMINGSGSTKQMTIKTLSSNQKNEYTKYFLLDVGSDFTSGQSIALKFTNNNSSGTIDIFTDDGSTYIAPNITIQAVGTTTLWGSSINDIAIGDSTPSTGLFSTIGIGTTSLNNGLYWFKRPY